MMSPIRFGLACLTATAALLCAGPASAQLRPLSDQDMSASHAQGLLDLTNSSFVNTDGLMLYTTRIALGADVRLNANFGKINLGAPVNGLSGPDWNQSYIDMPVLQFGRMDGTLAQRTVQITNPYFEIIYRADAMQDAGSREVVGMRFGFESIAGDVGMTLRTLSGSMDIAGVGVIEGMKVAGPAIGGVTAGTLEGPSRDFWIAALKTAVQFPTTPAGLSSPTAQAGFWLNWRDRLTAINGAVPPNAFRR